MVSWRLKRKQILITFIWRNTRPKHNTYWLFAFHAIQQNTDWLLSFDAIQQYRQYSNTGRYNTYWLLSFYAIQGRDTTSNVHNETVLQEQSLNWEKCDYVIHNWQFGILNSHISLLAFHFQFIVSLQLTWLWRVMLWRVNLCNINNNNNKLIDIRSTDEVLGMYVPTHRVNLLFPQISRGHLHCCCIVHDPCSAALTTPNTWSTNNSCEWWANIVSPSVVVIAA